ncbi:unnamed protein product [Lampetra planeri]
MKAQKQQQWDDGDRAGGTLFKERDIEASRVRPEDAAVESDVKRLGPLSSLEHSAPLVKSLLEKSSPFCSGLLLRMADVVGEQQL